MKTLYVFVLLFLVGCARVSTPEQAKTTRFVGLHYGWQTTETLTVLPGWEKQLTRFQSAFGCHLPDPGSISSAVSFRVVVDNKTVSTDQNPAWGERHRGIETVTAEDEQTGASFRGEIVTETWEGTTKHPITRQESATIRRADGSLLYERQLFAVKVE